MSKNVKAVAAVVMVTAAVSMLPITSQPSAAMAGDVGRVLLVNGVCAEGTECKGGPFDCYIDGELQLWGKTYW